MRRIFQYMQYRDELLFNEKYHIVTLITEQSVQAFKVSTIMFHVIKGMYDSMIETDNDDMDTIELALNTVLIKLKEN